MRLVVHIGMPKSGSTALQTALASARGELRQRGILYPRGALNQNLLVTGIAPPDHLGRMLTQRYQGDEARIQADFTTLITALSSEIERTKPSVTVLSAEFLYGPVGNQGPHAVRSLLAPLRGAVEIVCYVRRPSDYYLSKAQQRLKASWQLPALGPVRYRPTLESALGAAEIVHAIPFDRERFPRGDIVADFARRVVPEAESVLLSVQDPKVKPSMSAEAMAIVQEFRRERYPDANDCFTRDTGVLSRHLAAREVEMGGQLRPRLRPEIAALIDRCSMDLLWLRDRLAISFDGVDYASLGAQSGCQPENVSDICIVDPDRKAALQATMRDIVWPEGETARKSFRAAPKRATSVETIGTGRKGLLRFLRLR